MKKVQADREVFGNGNRYLILLVVSRHWENTFTGDYFTTSLSAPEVKKCVPSGCYEVT